MRIAFITFLLFAFYGTERVYGQLGTPVFPQVQVVAPAPYYLVAPQTVLVPQVQMIPYQYQRTEIMQRDYRTPLRDLFFGRYRIDHYYAPQVAR